MNPKDEAARQRRRQWDCGVTSKGAGLADDLAFWRAASASTKLAAIRAMADEAEIIKGHVPPAGFQRSVGGIRRARVDLPNSTAGSHEQSLGEVDTTLVDAMLALSPEERLRHNDRMLRTIELLRQGIAEQSADDGPANR